MTTPLRRKLVTSVACLTFVLPIAAAAADAPVNVEMGQRGGRPEAPEAPVACMEAVKARLPNPDRFRWLQGTSRRVAEDVYSVVGSIEFVNQAGEARKGEAQCDVMRAPGNQFIVPKVRLPQ